MTAFRHCRSLILAAAALGPLAAVEEGDLKDAAGAAVLHYAIEVPKELPPADTTDPAKQLGLVLCYHEHDGHAADEVKTVLASLDRLKLTPGYVVLGVQHVEHIYTKEHHTHTVELIAWAEKTWAINPRRVVEFGRGEGATMSAEFALEHPELIAAAITYSWGFRSMPTVPDAEKSLPGLYIAIGLKDYKTHPPMVRDTYAKAKPHGYHIIYREFADAGPSNHPPTNDDALRWATSSRNPVQPLSAREAELVKPLTGFDPAKPPPASAALFANAALVGGPQVGAMLAPLLRAPGNDAARALAVKSAEHAVYGEEAMAAVGGVLLTDRNAALRKDAIAALAVNAGWGSHAAQAALAAFASGSAGGATPGKPADAAERELAIAAIGQAVALQAVHQQDVALFKTLVALLDDESPGVRAQAFAVLKPLQASDYHPEAGKAARAPTLAAWQKWLEDITAKEPAGPAEAAPVK